MLALLADDHYVKPAPGSWLSHAVVRVDGVPIRFGLARLPDTAFDSAADYNRQHVFLRVRAFSLNYRDRALMTTGPGRMLSGLRGVGSDFVADVLAVGSEVTSVCPGQRVIPQMEWPPRPGFAATSVPTDSASREYLRLPHQQVMGIPDSMPDPVAAAFPLNAQTVFSMIRRLDLQPGEKVLVCAATSNTGLSAIDALRHRGVEVFALTRSPEAAAALRGLGVTSVFYGPLEHGRAELLGAARAMRGFDAVIDPFSDTYLQTSIAAMGFGGRYVTCRLGGGPPTATGSAAEFAIMMQSVVAKNLTIMGNCLGTRQDLADALAAWSAGKLAPVIDSAHCDGEIMPFLERSLCAGDRFGKVVYQYV
jgi:NADPH:quinone reductase-like Zn-dependent oxidoreductase